MNDICYEYLYYILVVYLDQILVYSKDLVEYTKYVQTPSPSPTPWTCLLCKLGLVISTNGVSKNLKKVEALFDWQTP